MNSSVGTIYTKEEYEKYKKAMKASQISSASFLGVAAELQHAAEAEQEPSQDMITRLKLNLHWKKLIMELCV